MRLEFHDFAPIYSVRRIAIYEASFFIETVNFLDAHVSHGHSNFGFRKTWRIPARYIRPVTLPVSCRVCAGFGRVGKHQTESCIEESSIVASTISKSKRNQVGNVFTNVMEDRVRQRKE